MRFVAEVAQSRLSNLRSATARTDDIPGHVQQSRVCGMEEQLESTQAIRTPTVGEPECAHPFQVFVFGGLESSQQVGE